MDIKLKHDKKKCWACRYQDKINKLCKNYPFGIEYDFFKDAGSVVVNESYTAEWFDKKGKKFHMPLIAPLEIQTYKRNSPIELFHTLSSNSIKSMIKEADLTIKKLSTLQIPKNLIH